MVASECGCAGGEGIGGGGSGRAKRAVLGRSEDVRWAAGALVAGLAVAHGFGNFYALTARPEAAVVRRVNLMKGRPPGRTGSVTTAPARIPLLFDWARLPAGIGHREVTALIDALFTLGPFGFQGPAPDDLPSHLTADSEDGRTVQVIAPGYSCPSNDFLSQAVSGSRGDLLFITSANRSRFATGAAEEPAHWRAAALRAEFGQEAGVRVLEHADEEAARRNHPLHEPMSTSVLAFHRTDGVDEHGRPRLVLQRHGSLPLEQIRQAAERFGFGLALGPGAQQRLAKRQYD
ncbi:hypothetical protein ACFC1R_04415 [Kitasatospora sp. NPDC056138]|uniref:hypothetical protein n=1 Tax=Kitasatospora sp. NPDC056138 TaxID=3345724 RepID=UPI0035DE4114